MSLLRGEGIRLIGGQAHSSILATFLESSAGRRWLDEVVPFLRDDQLATPRAPWRDVLGRLRYMKDLCKLKADELHMPEAKHDLMFYVLVHADHSQLASLLADLEDGLGPQPDYAEEGPRAVMRSDLIGLKGMVEFAKELASRLVYVPEGSEGTSPAQTSSSISSSMGGTCSSSGGGSSARGSTSHGSGGGGGGRVSRGSLSSPVERGRGLSPAVLQDFFARLRAMAEDPRDSRDPADEPATQA
uniref:Uncharacterized protein n=1 Tax=Haptolina brevifila TaxID=156173 RepID=A0A7S2DNY2_9EUKA